ncbi:Membrane associated eicosanoid/glutathione metabolism-like domain superfamily protein [Pleurotus pulmonarius]
MSLPFDLSSPGFSLYSIPAAWFCAFYPNTLRFLIIDKTVGYDNTNPRDNLAKTRGNDKFKPSVVEKIHRMEGAHQNGNEAFPLWAAAIITGNLVGLDHRTLNICSIAYIGLRLLYNYVYISHNSFLKGWPRSVVFFTGLSIPLWLLVQSARKSM